MSTQSKSTFGGIGLLALAAFLVLAVSLSNLLIRGVRLDLTENQLYTLSDGTRQVLEGIPEPVNLYLFFSDRATGDIPYLRTYAGRVREMLQEFEQAAGGKLRLQVIDPLPFSEEEDRASQFGLQSIDLGGAGDPIYLGVAGTNSVGDEEIIAFLDPNKEQFLEYDLAKLVYTLAYQDRPVIALISGLPMSGGFDPVTQQMRQPWVVVQQIQQLFELRTLGTEVTAIDADVDVLMVVHPKNLGEDTLYAIDQFILRGGRALLFVDPWAEVDLPPDPTNPMASFGVDRSSSLNRLLEAWGISVPTDEIVGDDRYALTVSGLAQRPVRHLAFVGAQADALAGSDPITAGLNVLNFAFVGHIVREDDAKATVEPLVESSDLAAPIETTRLAILPDPDELRDDFAPTGVRYLLAARIGGKLPSAFPDGPTAPPGGEAQAPEGHLAEAADAVNVVLVADADLLSDRLWVQTQNFFGQRLNTAFANNGDLVVNALDNLTGSGALISIRSRATFTRPFTKVQDLRREAENQFQRREQELQQQLRDTESRLTELQANREDSSAVILTSEQELELERFQDERLRIRKELRQVQRNLDQSIEDLGTALKVINIFLVPLIISLLSLSLWFWRRRQGQASR